MRKKFSPLEEYSFCGQVKVCIFARSEMVKS